jgi:hypothetical protein
MRHSLALSLTILAAVTLPAAESLTPPKAWLGSATVPQAGNPSADGNWRLDRVYGEVETTASWTPMVWGGKSWVAPDHSFGGQPAATGVSRSVELGIRGPWAGGGDADGDKSAALVFIAPAAGTYVVENQVTCNRWQGDGIVYLRLMRREKAKAFAVTEIDTTPLEPKGDTKLDPQKVVLAAGDELGFVAQVAAFHSGASVTVTPIITAQP